MREPVGTCLGCGKQIFCEDGFLQGVVKKDGVVCFDCEDQADKQAEDD